MQHLTRVAHGERRHKCIFPRCTKSFTRPGMLCLPSLSFEANSDRPTKTTHPVYSQGRPGRVLSISDTWPVCSVFCHLIGPIFLCIHDGHYYIHDLLPSTYLLPTHHPKPRQRTTHGSAQKERRDLSPVYDTPCYLFIYYIIISTCMCAVIICFYYARFTESIDSGVNLFWIYYMISRLTKRWYFSCYRVLCIVCWIQHWAEGLRSIQALSRTGVEDTARRAFATRG